MLKLINPENASETEAEKYRLRTAARAVVLDENNKIALLYVSKFQYYKLPGGGVEPGEDLALALERECIEEIGCKVEVLQELGSILEYRKSFGLKQTSHCFLAKVLGEKGESNFTEKELSHGFEIQWFDYEEALEKLKNSRTDLVPDGFFPMASYVVPRDIAFLEEAKKFLD